ncbi:hypothetical protein PoB_005274000 [Plakobranchus ocellatus]|uniref:Uncharacterized protein n=1 Tax=Plakobranchus ocellatus TaxID=259542 RepID=A0AAV4C4C7_9GAST|nr:hypothetical protein PoB_005274000 [Plakobranchus ocellatus]
MFPPLTPDYPSSVSSSDGCSPEPQCSSTALLPEPVVSHSVAIAISNIAKTSPPGTLSCVWQRREQDGTRWNRVEQDPHLALLQERDPPSLKTHLLEHYLVCGRGGNRMEQGGSRWKAMEQDETGWNWVEQDPHLALLQERDPPSLKPHLLEHYLVCGRGGNRMEQDGTGWNSMEHQRAIMNSASHFEALTLETGLVSTASLEIVVLVAVYSHRFYFVFQADSFTSATSHGYDINTMFL